MVKYRNGNRTNRAAGSGFWKTAGKDKLIMSSRGDQVIGIKKFFVFYRGKPLHGQRTDWVMHEYYYLAPTDSSVANYVRTRPTQFKSPSSGIWVVTQLIDWLFVCRRKTGCSVIHSRRRNPLPEEIQSMNRMITHHHHHLRWVASLIFPMVNTIVKTKKVVTTATLPRRSLDPLLIHYPSTMVFYVFCLFLS